MQGALATIQAAADSIPDEIASTNAFRASCRDEGAHSLATLVEIRDNADAPNSARIAAARVILAYGYGLPRQTISLQAAVVDPREREKAHKENQEAVQRAMLSAMEGMGVIVPQPQDNAPLPADYVHTMPGVDSERTRHAAAIVTAAVSAAMKASDNSITIESSDTKNPGSDDSLPG